MPDLTVLQRETLNTIIMRHDPYRLAHRDGDIACAVLTLAARGLIAFDSENEGRPYALQERHAAVM